MCPKPGRAYTAPYPPWYKPDLTCVYHMEAPGHSIETCEPFRWHVLSLLDANLIGIKGPNITTQPMPDHDKGNGVAVIEKDRLWAKSIEELPFTLEELLTGLKGTGYCLKINEEQIGTKRGACLYHPQVTNHDTNGCQ